MSTVPHIPCVNSNDSLCTLRLSVCIATCLPVPATKISLPCCTSKTLIRRPGGKTKNKDKNGLLGGRKRSESSTARERATQGMEISGITAKGSRQSGETSSAKPTKGKDHVSCVCLPEAQPMPHLTKLPQVTHAYFNPPMPHCTHADLNTPVPPCTNAYLKSPMPHCTNAYLNPPVPPCTNAYLNSPMPPCTNAYLRSPVPPCTNASLHQCLLEPTSASLHQCLLESTNASLHPCQLTFTNVPLH